jgi:hypothetical protein
MSAAAETHSLHSAAIRPEKSSKIVPIGCDFWGKSFLWMLRVIVFVMTATRP